jgi:4-amino-4-deoxy-L-arabinose transferase-like glycosyltransferase
MKKLLICLLLKFILLAAIIAFDYIALAPDEAQYWVWSQDLDWGYYSKPPGIAWQIWLTTRLFGNTPLGVRFGSLIFGFFFPMVIYKASLWGGLQKKTALWAAFIMAFSPLGIYLSLTAVTDCGSIFFMTLALALMMRGIRNIQGPPYLTIGGSVLAAALFKWTAFLMWPFIFAFCLLDKRLWKKTFFAGFALSLLALVPTLYWNTFHEWATFRHVGKTMANSASGNFFDFFISQLGILSPIFFFLMLASFFYMKSIRNLSLFFAASFPACILFYLCLSFFKKMQPNWAAYLYTPGCMVAAWVACEKMKNGMQWLKAGIASSLVLVSIAFLLPWIQSHSHLPLAYSLNPWRQALGWQKLESTLLASGYNPESHFLFGDKYQTASLLSFYGPLKKRAYFFNLGNSRKNQFSYWPQMAEKEVGNTGYFVVLENCEEKALPWYRDHYLSELSVYSSSVEFKGAYPLFTTAGHPVKHALIFCCSSYLGNMPQEEKVSW